MTPALIQLQIDQARLDRLANVDLFEWLKARLMELDKITAKLREAEALLGARRGQLLSLFDDRTSMH